MRLCVLFLTLLTCIARGLQFPRFFCTDQSFFRVKTLSAFPFPWSFCWIEASAGCGPVCADLASYLAVGVPRWSVKTRRAPIPRLHTFAVLELVTLSFPLNLVCCRLEVCNSVPGDCAAVCSKSASLHLATELRLLEVERHVLDLAASHRLDHLCLSLHLWNHDSSAYP